MLLHTSADGGRKIRLNKTEVRKLKDAKTILNDLSQFAGVNSLNEAINRIQEDGTVGELQDEGSAQALNPEDHEQSK